MCWHTLSMLGAQVGCLLIVVFLSFMVIARVAPRRGVGMVICVRQ